MASTPRSGLPEFWATGIAKLLVGAQPCQFEAWMKGHYRIEKRPRSDEGSLAKWKANHSAQLMEATAKLRRDGWKCDVERYFKVTGQTAILSGKVDLITQKKDCRPVIRDVKSGKPEDQDAAQVMVYMIAIPMAWESPDMVFDGEVIYPSHTLKVTPREASEIRPQLFALLKRLGSSERPPANPGETSCRWCDVNETDCPQRFKGEPIPVTTSEW